MKKLISSFLFTAVLLVLAMQQLVPGPENMGTLLEKEAVVPDGIYMIQNSGDKDIIGYANGAFDIRKNNRQFFNVNKSEAGYKITDMAQNAMTAQWDGVRDRVILWADISAPNQMWRIYQSENGYRIQYSGSKQFLTEENGQMHLSAAPSEFAFIQQVDYAGKPFTYYSMVDGAWADRKYSYRTMSVAGCGPTSLAMIINYYSQQTVTPLTVADISVGNQLDILASPRTDMPKLVPLIAEQFGVSYKVIGKADVVSELKNGNTVLLGTLKNPAINYTLGQGHFLVLRGLDKNGWIIVNDPLAVHTYHTKADPTVENYNFSFNYVAPADAVLAKGTEYYSFWSK